MEGKTPVASGTRRVLLIVKGTVHELVGYDDGNDLVVVFHNENHSGEDQQGGEKVPGDLLADGISASHKSDLVQPK